jgi:hypothetical protein
LYIFAESVASFFQLHLDFDLDLHPFEILSHVVENGNLVAPVRFVPLCQCLDSALSFSATNNS